MTERKLSLLSKICFAVGGLPYQMCGNSLVLFITPFLLEQAQIRPIQISIILFSSKAIDAITNPIVGFLVRTTNTKIGKFRPWIIFSTPFTIASYMMIWYVPNISRELKTYWYLLFYCLYHFSSSCHRVSYSSLTMYLTTNQKERDTATGYRMIFEVVGVLLAAVIQGAMINIYGAKYQCPNVTSIFNSTEFNQSIELVTKKTGYNKLSEGYLVSGGIICFIYLFCSLMTFFGTREIKDVTSDKEKSFLSAIRSVFTHKSYLSLLSAYLFYSLAIQILETNISLYCKYTVNAKDTYQNVLVALLVSSILWLPVLRWMMVKVGKKTTYIIGALSLIPCLIGLLFLKQAGWHIYIITSICGFGISTNFLLPWTMLPDVIDEFFIKTGTRCESIFYAFFVFFNKLSGGIAVAVTSAILDVTGYVDCPYGCCTQPSSVGYTLRLLVVPGPVIMLLITLVSIFFHSINEKRRQEIKESLDKIRGIALLAKE